MGSSFSIVVLDREPLLYLGLQTVLRKARDIRLGGLAPNVRAASEMIRKLRPRLLIVEPSLPDKTAYGFMRQVRARHPRMRVLVLSREAAPEQVRAAFAAGATGYLTKDCDPGQLPSILRAVAAGHVLLSPAITGLVLEGKLRSPAPSAAAARLLTSQETKILQLIAQGGKTKEIAARLGISARTIEAHRSSIMKKLEVHSTAGLTRFAVGAGLVPPG